MLSDRQLRNFGHYLALTPKADWGKPPNPAGAYDSRSGSHGFHDRRLSMSHFSRGGAFDAVGETGRANVHEAMQFIASKLSKEDWAAFQRALCGERDDDDTEANDDMSPRGIKDPDPRAKAMDSAVSRRRSASANAQSFYEMFPEAARVQHV